MKKLKTALIFLLAGAMLALSACELLARDNEDATEPPPVAGTPSPTPPATPVPPIGTLPEYETPVPPIGTLPEYIPPVTLPDTVEPEYATPVPPIGTLPGYVTPVPPIGTIPEYETPVTLPETIA